ncbi:MAG TPA: aldo/keto reductase, partial [Bacteroidales bacterium]|nr:aldo/keto reductase [Bacteroidales bacterium]
MALGTVQFGLDYGVKNSRGRVPENEVAEILEYALDHGIDTLDTASAYGESEMVLGHFLSTRNRFHVISKLPAIPKKQIRIEVETSLERLGISSLYGYLLHNYKTWQDNPHIMDELVSCREAGLIEKIGISLYHPNEATTLMEQGVALDLVQVPYSLIDRRFEIVFPQLAAYGTEIHVRSLFLQGILFMDPDSLHPRFDPIRESIRSLQKVARDQGFPIASLCLAPAATNTYIS